MRIKNPVEKKSLQEQSRGRHLSEERIHIPLYADDYFNDELKKQEYREQMRIKNEEYQEVKRLRREELMEERSKLLKFTEVNGQLLSLCAIMLILCITSVIMGSLVNALYSIIGIISTLYIGRRLTFVYSKSDSTLNVLLWNITQTLNDFIEYRIKYDIEGSYNSIINKSYKVMMISLLFLNSNSVIYGLSLLGLMVGFLMALAYRDFYSITSILKKLVLCAVAGIFVKAIISNFIFKKFTIDFFNVVLVNIFLIINMLEGIELEQPLE